MPGFDGTGPRGMGPMTGKAGGFCLMKIPDNPEEAKTGFTGFTGWAGKSMNIPDDPRVPEISMLHDRMRELRAGLREAESQLARLEARSRAKREGGAAS